MAFTIGTITSVKDTFRYSTPGKINTEDPRYKALEKDGTLAAIMDVSFAGTTYGLWGDGRPRITNKKSYE